MSSVHDLVNLGQLSLFLYFSLFNKTISYVGKIK